MAWGEGTSFAPRASAASPLLGEYYSCRRAKPEPVCPSRSRRRGYLCDAAGRPATYGWDLRLTLTCLQGIVNRSQPRLYLVQDNYDRLWLDWLRRRGDVEGPLARGGRGL